MPPGFFVLHEMRLAAGADSTRVLAAAQLAGVSALPSYYRMAVTESSTNGEPRAIVDRPASADSAPPLRRAREATEADLLWIGTPLASETGLLLITGHDDASAFLDAGPTAWSLPTNRELGVRIYESARP